MKTNFFYDFIEQKIAPLGIKIGEQKHIAAIKDSFLEIISFITIGSVFMLVQSLGQMYLPDLINPINGAIQVGIDITFYKYFIILNKYILIYVI